MRQIPQSDEYWGLGLSLMRLGPLEVLCNQLKIWAILGLLGIRMQKRGSLYVCRIPLKGMEAAFSVRGVLQSTIAKKESYVSNLTNWRFSEVPYLGDLTISLGTWSP